MRKLNQWQFNVDSYVQWSHGEVKEISQEPVQRMEGTASPTHSLLIHSFSLQLEHILPKMHLSFCSH